MYCFSPFSLLGRVLQKLALNKSDAILILPRCPTQAWFFGCHEHAYTHLPILLPQTPDLLTATCPSALPLPTPQYGADAGCPAGPQGSGIFC